MRKELIVELLKDENPEALLANGFEKAFIGLARRKGQPTLATYNVEKCIEVLVERDIMTADDAWEFFEFNVSGAWMGEHTPIFVYPVEE